jgi:hypothetical protein
MLKLTGSTKVNVLRISIEVNEKLVGISLGCGNRLREVAKIYVCLEAIQFKIKKYASRVLERRLQREWHSSVLCHA